MWFVVSCPLAAAAAAVTRVRVSVPSFDYFQRLFRYELGRAKRGGKKKKKEQKIEQRFTERPTACRVVSGCRRESRPTKCAQVRDASDIPPLLVPHSLFL